MNRYLFSMLTLLFFLGLTLITPWLFKHIPFIVLPILLFGAVLLMKQELAQGVS